MYEQIPADLLALVEDVLPNRRPDATESVWWPNGEESRRSQGSSRDEGG